MRYQLTPIHCRPWLLNGLSTQLKPIAEESPQIEVCTSPHLAMERIST